MKINKFTFPRMTFNFSNKPEGSSETCLLTVKHHQGPVYCCHWSQDGSDRIVSCGGDFNVKVISGFYYLLLLTLKRCVTQKIS